MEGRFPEDTAVRSCYLPELRALLARNHHDFENAIDLLQPGPVDELGSPPSTFLGFFGGLYPAYLRGEARLLQGQGVEGAAEFQKIFDHPGIAVSQPIGALGAFATRQSTAPVRRQSQGQERLRSLPGSVERGRWRHPYPYPGKSRIREAIAADNAPQRAPIRERFHQMMCRRLQRIIPTSSLVA